MNHVTLGKKNVGEKPFHSWVCFGDVIDELSSPDVNDCCMLKDTNVLNGRYTVTPDKRICKHINSQNFTKRNQDSRLPEIVQKVLPFISYHGILDGGNSNIFWYFHPRSVGKGSNLTNIFQRGWNHQLVYHGIPSSPHLTAGQSSWCFRSQSSGRGKEPETDCFDLPNGTLPVTNINDGLFWFWW